MAAYDYEALDPRGRTRRGVISADSARAARQELKRQQLIPVRLDTASEQRDAPAAGWQRRLRPAAAVLTKDLSLVTRQLATLVGASAPVEEALNTIALQSDKPAVRKTLLSVRAGVMEGRGLAEALAGYPRSFPPLYRSLVAAGESTGSLGAVLERLADYLEKSRAMRTKVTSALIYPAFLAITAVAVIVILMTFVVPKVVEQFDSLGQDLPLLTRIMIGISDVLQSYGLIMAVMIVAAIAAAARAYTLPRVRLAVDRAVLSVPFVGRLMREMLAARLARTLSTLLASGAPVVDGLAAARKTVHNAVLSDALAEVIGQVREGTGLSQALRRAGAFPPMIVYMTAMGERSGRLDEMLDKAAVHLEQEFEAVTAAVLGLLEPLIIIVMGALVALIVLSILLPILQLNTLTLG
ncbi:MAG: type II secretion system inner membrane protein GspF [Rhodothalassiaceae bacterium]